MASQAEIDELIAKTPVARRGRALAAYKADAIRSVVASKLPYLVKDGETGFSCLVLAANLTTVDGSRNVELVVRFFDPDNLEITPLDFNPWTIVNPPLGVRSTEMFDAQGLPIIQIKPLEALKRILVAKTLQVAGLMP